MTNALPCLPRHPRELGFEAGIFVENRKIKKTGLTNEKTVVYLCPIAPDDGMSEGAVLKKSQKKQIFDLTKRNSMLYFILTPLMLRGWLRRC